MLRDLLTQDLSAPTILLFVVLLNGASRSNLHANLMKPYDLISHTADIGLKVRGRTLKDLFENAAKGMFWIAAGKAKKFKDLKVLSLKVDISGEAGDFEELLVDWLSELLYLSNKKKILFTDFKVQKLEEKSLVSKVQGVKVDPKKFPIKTEIKAVTFHNLKIEKDSQGFHADIIFDV